MSNGDKKPPNKDSDSESDVGTLEKNRTEKPRKWCVLFHNDDYTTMDFVVLVLMRYFHKSEPEAHHVMLTVHHKGRAVAGIYTRDIAETKAEEVMSVARENGFPLLLTTEPESE